MAVSFERCLIVCLALQVLERQGLLLDLGEMFRFLSGRSGGRRYYDSG